MAQDSPIYGIRQWQKWTFESDVACEDSRDQQATSINFDTRCQNLRAVDNKGFSSFSVLRD
jgi:hypothetical protein